MLRIVNNICEFRKSLKESPGEIIGLVYPSVDIAESATKKIEQVFSDENIGLVYSDIILSTKTDSYPHIYSSYENNTFINHPIVLSPIFVRSSAVLDIDFNITYLWAHCLLINYSKKLFPYRIPEILFKVGISEDEQEQIAQDIRKIHANEHISNNN